MELLLAPRTVLAAAHPPANPGSAAGRAAHNGYDRAQSIKPLAEERLPGPEDDKARKRAEDAALLARVLDRDERAIEALYARYSGPLYSLAYRVTGAERFAQDVVQEVFVALWKDAGASTPPWRCRVLVFALARHKAIDLVRAEANVRKHTADVDLEFHEAEDDVDHEAWLRLRRDRVRAAIVELPEAERTALELAFFAGLTHVEVAERLDIPLGTAKTRIRTALLRCATSWATRSPSCPARRASGGADA